MNTSMLEQRLHGDETLIQQCRDDIDEIKETVSEITAVLCILSDALDSLSITRKAN